MHPSHPKESTPSWRTIHGNFFDRVPVLVTGGAGFIGSHLTCALDQLGASVVVLDDLSGGSLENLGACKSLVFVQASLLDLPRLAQAMAGCRYVFHQAALGSVPLSVREPRRFNDANITGTLNVLETARSQGIRRIMFAASSSAYGDNPAPWVETMPARPQSPYAATKVACEALLRAYSASYDLDAVSLRYFNIFGPRQNPNSAYAAVIAAFAKALLSNQPPIIHGDGHQSRDFTYVDNVVHANLLAARHPEPLGGEVLNVGCAHQTSINDLASQMAAALGRTDLTPRHESPRAGDLEHSLADISRARSTLGYEPLVDFPTGLQRTMDWYAGMLAASR